ncbi:MAG: hypothetical protein U0414_29330 [Polyangiaceae bacterium]
MSARRAALSTEPDERDRARVAAASDRDLRAEIARARARVMELHRWERSARAQPVTPRLRGLRASREARSPRTAYRDLDPSARLDRELEELHARAAALAIEHAIARAMIERERASRLRTRARLVSPVALSAIGVVLFASTQNLGVLLGYAALVGHALAFSRLVAAITPARR